MHVEINGKSYTAQVQKSNEEIIQGMQGRTFQGFDCMYFDLPLNYHTFHTRNCIVPLDIVFVYQNKVMNMYPNCWPNSEEKYSSYCDAVIEFPGNTVFQNKINIGTKIQCHI